MVTPPLANVRHVLEVLGVLGFGGRGHDLESWEDERLGRLGFCVVGLLIDLDVCDSVGVVDWMHSIGSCFFSSWNGLPFVTTRDGVAIASSGEWSEGVGWMELRVPRIVLDKRRLCVTGEGSKSPPLLSTEHNAERGKARGRANGMQGLNSVGESLRLLHACMRYTYPPRIKMAVKMKLSIHFTMRHKKIISWATRIFRFLCCTDRPS